MSKKIFTFLFVCFMMLFALTACGGKKDDPKPEPEPEKPGVVDITVETNMTAGESYKVTVTTENLEESVVLTWNVSDPTVASLNEETLMIEALKAGTFTLSVTAGEDVSDSVDVTVAPKPLETYTITYDGLTKEELESLLEKTK